VRFIGTRPRGSLRALVRLPEGRVLRIPRGRSAARSQRQTHQEGAERGTWGGAVGSPGMRGSRVRRQDRVARGGEAWCEDVRSPGWRGTVGQTWTIGSRTEPGTYPVGGPCCRARACRPRLQGVWHCAAGRIGVGRLGHGSLKNGPVHR